MALQRILLIAIRSLNAPLRALSIAIGWRLREDNRFVYCLMKRTDSMPTKKKQGKTHTTAGEINPAKGKLGIMIPGMGAVATTFVAGVEAVREGISKPIGSLTQMATVRLGKRTEGRSPKIKDFVPLAGLNDLVFGTWDIFEDNCYEAAQKAGVLETPMLDKLREPLSAIRPMKAVFDHEYVKRIDGPNKKTEGSKMDKAQMLMDDIRTFREKSGAARLAMIWCGSTEVYHKAAAVHQTLKDFECGLMKDDPEISPSQIY